MRRFSQRRSPQINSRRLQQLHGGSICFEQVVYFVPFNLEGNQDGHDIVGIAYAGNVDSQRLLAIIEPLSTPCRGGDGLPSIDMKSLLLEYLFRLPQQYQIAMDNRGR